MPRESVQRFCDDGIRELKIFTVESSPEGSQRALRFFIPFQQGIFPLFCVLAALFIAFT